MAQNNAGNIPQRDRVQNLPAGTRGGNMAPQFNAMGQLDPQADSYFPTTNMAPQSDVGNPNFPTTNMTPQNAVVSPNSFTSSGHHYYAANMAQMMPAQNQPMGAQAGNMVPQFNAMGQLDPQVNPYFPTTNMAPQSGFTGPYFPPTNMAPHSGVFGPSSFTGSGHNHDAMAHHYAMGHSMPTSSGIRRRPAAAPTVAHVAHAAQTAQAGVHKPETSRSRSAWTRSIIGNPRTMATLRNAMAHPEEGLLPGVSFVPSVTSAPADIAQETEAMYARAIWSHAQISNFHEILDYLDNHDPGLVDLSQEQRWAQRRNLAIQWKLAFPTIRNDAQLGPFRLGNTLWMFSPENKKLCILANMTHNLQTKQWYWAKVGTREPLWKCDAAQNSQQVTGEPIEAFGGGFAGFSDCLQITHPVEAIPQQGPAQPTSAFSPGVDGDQANWFSGNAENPPAEQLTVWVPRTAPEDVNLTSFLDDVNMTSFIDDLDMTSSLQDINNVDTTAPVDNPFDFNAFMNSFSHTSSDKENDNSQDNGNSADTKDATDGPQQQKPE